MRRSFLAGMFRETVRRRGRGGIPTNVTFIYISHLYEYYYKLMHIYYL